MLPEKTGTLDFIGSALAKRTDTSIRYNGLMITKDDIRKRRDEIIAVARRDGASDLRAIP